jgi:hypothetical protein
LPKKVTFFYSIESRNYTLESKNPRTEGVTEMKRTFLILMSLYLVLGVLPPANAGKTDNGKLDLYEQDSLGQITWDGAQGKLKFSLAGPSFEFDFLAHGLDPCTSYNLIRSREPEMALPNRFEVIASGTSNPGGSLSLAGSYKFNMGLLAGKILLVPAGYAPDTPVTYSGKYLFGHGPISYDDTGTGLKCGGIKSPGPSGWDQLGLQVGDKAVDFTLFGILGGPGSLTPGNQEQPLSEVKLSQLLEEKPVVLITGSFT